MTRSIAAYTLLFSFAILLTAGTARAQHGQEEKKSGYRGTFNKNIKVPANALPFIVMGDWGRNGEYHQKAVARQMSSVAATADATFVVAAGDNFYPSGVQSTRDIQWTSSFENIYNAYSLYCNWYVALGNHDYKGNIQAQIDYSQISRRWQLPSPYYAKKIKLKDSGELLLVVMDTNPFIDAYYVKDDEMGHNVAMQDTSAQKRWLEQTLSDPSPSIKWKIVVGHHPMYSGGKRKNSPDTDAIKRRFQSLFDRYHVAAYLCGHEHDLQVIRPEGHYTTQFLSGAGCEVRPGGTTDGSLFAASEPGFMLFSVTAGQMQVQVISATGKIRYTTTINNR